MLPSHGGKTGQVPTTIVTIERMVRAVIPDFRVEATSGSSIHPVSSQQGFDAGTVAMPSADGYGTLPGGPGPPRLYGTHGSGQSQDQSETLGEELGDFTAADVGLDFDFGTMDMDAFLSIDPNQDWGFRW